MNGTFSTYCEPQQDPVRPGRKGFLPLISIYCIFLQRHSEELVINPVCYTTEEVASSSLVWGLLDSWGFQPLKALNLFAEWKCSDFIMDVINTCFHHHLMVINSLTCVRGVLALWGLHWETSVYSFIWCISAFILPDFIPNAACKPTEDRRVFVLAEHNVWQPHWGELMCIFFTSSSETVESQ